MSLLTDKQIKLLKKNGLRSNDNLPPVVKLFNQAKGLTWLLYKCHPNDSNTVYGLYSKDNIGSRIQEVNLQQIESKDLKLENDHNFHSLHPITVYLDAADYFEGFTDNYDALEFVRSISKSPPRRAPL